MDVYDFDPYLQKILNKKFSGFSLVDWRDWLKITSPKEYEETCFKLAEFSRVDDLFESLKSKQTNSRDFSINIHDFLEKCSSSELPVLCHSSGTTSSEKSALKWFYMSDDFVQRNWAPGMQAIFQSSGLDSNTSAIIFVPSRVDFDGLTSEGGTRHVKMYTSEFSQRLMLSIIKPKSYLLYEYRNSKNLQCC